MLHFCRDIESARQLPLETLNHYSSGELSMKLSGILSIGRCSPQHLAHISRCLSYNRALCSWMLLRLKPIDLVFSSDPRAMRLDL